MEEDKKFASMNRKILNADIALLEAVVSEYEKVISLWKDASDETKTFLYKEKTKIEKRLNELRAKLLNSDSTQK